MNQSIHALAGRRALFIARSSCFVVLKIHSSTKPSFRLDSMNGKYSVLVYVYRIGKTELDANKQQRAIEIGFISNEPMGSAIEIIVDLFYL